MQAPLPDQPRWPARLFILLQYLLPQHLLSALMYRIARSEYPPLKNAIIRRIVKHFQVDMSAAQITTPTDYPSFNAFFTRALAPHARPIDSDALSLVSPVDGAVSQAGTILGDTLLQAKGHSYSVAALLGSDTLAETFNDGSFATIYLSPRDYHRIHMPLAGQLRSMTHIPGALFSVNQTTTAYLPGLFARNERVVNLFTTPAGPMALVMVGAIFVGSMDTVWAGTITPQSRRIASWDYSDDSTPAVQLDKGAEMGRFNMGSTVIVLLPENSVQLAAELQPGKVLRMGEVIGRVITG